LISCVVVYVVTCNWILKMFEWGNYFLLLFGRWHCRVGTKRLLGFNITVGCSFLCWMSAFVEQWKERL
jgi:hypothetical protein